jgi:hypothetical protein
MNLVEKSCFQRRAIWALPAALLMIVGAVGCHKKQPEQPEVVKHVPPKFALPGTTTGVVSDGIADGLQREVEMAARTHADAAERVRTVRPVLKCVEATSSSEWRAHFGFTNAGSTEVAIPASLFNRFWPPPMVRGQPKVFAAGSKDDVVQVAFDPRSSTAWVLGAGFALADAKSTPCPKGKI